jgi:YidC/Oxa1 family membrane protein insertase
MLNLFQNFFYEPIFNLLIFLYNLIPDIGVAIILLTILVKAALWPLSRKSIKSQKALQDLQPKLNELKLKHANDKQALGQAMMNLYKENKVSPFSSCLPILIQFPFLIAVYRVFIDGFKGKHFDLVYPFIKAPETINPIAFGFIDLSVRNIPLAVAAGLIQFIQTKMMMAKRVQPKVKGSKDEDMAAIMSKQMTYLMPALTVFIGLSLPGGLTLYWFITTLLMFVQQVLIFRKDTKEREKKTGIIEGQAQIQ